MKEKQQIIDTFKEYKLLDDHVDINSFEDSFDDTEKLREEIDTYISESVQIIYYSRAMEFLMENDTSLRDSLEIAAEYGYETANLNSELLASLLLQRMVTEELVNFINDVESLEDVEEAA